MDRITVNESLAKGLLKRAYREDTERYSSLLASALSKHQPKSHRKGNVFRSLCKAIREGLDEYIIFEQKAGETKQQVNIYTCWNISKKGLSAEIIILRRKQPEPVSIEILRVSRHAAERVFERLNTTDIYSLKPEFLHCVFVTFELFVTNVDYKKYPEGIEVQTPNGVAILKHNEGPSWSVVTWIDKNKPREGEGKLTRPLYKLESNKKFVLNI